MLTAGPQSTYLFERLVIPNSDARYRVTDSPPDETQLAPLAKINIFVGPNNSGKSRLMRTLVAAEKLTGYPQAATWSDLDGYAKLWETARREGQRIIAEFDQWNIRDVNNTRILVDRLAGPVRFTEGLPLDKQFKLVSDIAMRGQVDSAVDTQGRDVGRSSHAHQALGHARNIAAQINQRVASSGLPAGSFPTAAKLYVPVLRSLRDITARGQDDVLADCTRRAYFEGAKHVQVFTGQTLFTSVEDLALGDLEGRRRLRRFEHWIGESFFKGQPVALIPRKGSTVLTIKIGDEQEKPVHDLGDGIQSLLVLTFPLFERADEHLLVFIEEPELFLHPWLQRVLLEVLSGPKFPRHQYFLTTHSNHFLDLTVDIDSVSVFAFDKQLEGETGSERRALFDVCNVSREDRRPLELLGVRNSSVFLSNCTIWVEGITDRRYLARWLELLQIEKCGGATTERRAHFYKEDLHYSFVEYGGGNVVHWSFLDDEGPDVDRLCGTLFLIADKDDAKPGSAKADRHETLRRSLGDRFYSLPCREIENLLTPTAIKAVLLSYGEHDANIANVRQETYAGASLGRFIETKIIKDPSQKVRQASYAAASGTINTKVDFCERAIATTRLWSDISPDAQALTEQVYAFIRQNNTPARATGSFR
jgi:predicted ATP-dependent endonuclease of OLD family